MRAVVAAGEATREVSASAVAGNAGETSREVSAPAIAGTAASAAEATRDASASARVAAPKRSPEETTAYLGMVIALASWAMMFAALFFAYAFVRSRSPLWPPPGVPRIDPLFPALNTVVIAASSVLLEVATRRTRAHRVTGLLLATLGLGALFLLVQTWLWLELGLAPGEGGTYSSVVFGLCALHALHVLVGLVGLGRQVLPSLRGLVPVLPLRLWSVYWHFVGVVWLVLFVTVFVL